MRKAFTTILPLALMAATLATCTDGKVTDPADAPVAAVELNLRDVVIRAGESHQLLAWLRDAAKRLLNNRPVSWQSSDPAIATVNSTGLVRGVKPGKATVTAASSGRSASAAVTVTAGTLASLKVEPASATVKAGQSLQLQAVARDENGFELSGVAISWASSNPAVASVSASGLVQAVRDGAATITADAGNGVTSSSAITVPVELAASVRVQPDSVLIMAGATTSFQATVRAGDGSVLSGRTVQWRSSNTSVASVAGDGTVTGLNGGWSYIIATVDAVTDTAVVAVRAQNPQPVILALWPAEAQAGSSAVDLVVVGSGFVSGSVIRWNGAERTTTFVNPTELQTRLSAADLASAGSFPVTVVSPAPGGGASAAVNFTVNAPAPPPPAPVATVVISPASGSVQVGATLTYSARTLDAAGAELTGRAVTWTSLNQAVATVSAGVVRGVAAGTTTIQATSEGRTGTATVTVTATTPPPPPPPTPVATVTVTPATGSINVGGSVQLSAVTRDASGNVLSGRAITWTSSATGIASVSSSGLVSGVAAGTATITATSEGRTGSATITVSAAAPAVTRVVSTPAVDTLDAIGAIVQLSAQAFNAAGSVVSGAGISWTSLNTNIATVDAMGRVTAQAVGTALITAASVCCNAADTTRVVVRQVVSSVAVAPATASVQAGASVQLAATARDAMNTAIPGLTATWTTSNAAVATVSSNGQVTGVAAGTATISAAIQGRSGSATVTVTTAPNPAPTVSSLSPNTATAGATGTTVSVQGTGFVSNSVVQWNGANRPTTYVSATQLQASISAADLASAGTAQVRVVNPAPGGGTSTALAFTIAAASTTPAAVTDLTVSSVSTNSVTVRWTQVQDGTGDPARYAVQYDSPTLSWSLNSPTLVQVDGSAVGQTMTHTYTNLAPGTQYQLQLMPFRGTNMADVVMGPLSNLVTVTTQASSPSPTVTSVVASQSSYAFTQVGQTVQLTASARDASGGIITGVALAWSSTNSSVVSVDNMGLVTARGAGTALVIVSATCCSASDTVQFSVPGTNPPPPAGSTIFSDGFESGNLSGAQGGAWYGATRAAVSNQRARTGNYSLRFEYPGSSDINADAWSEIRGRFPEAPEVWLEWYLYVPTNYEHRQANPANNKFWILGYDDHMHDGWQGQAGGWTVRMEINPASATGALSRTRLVYGNQTSGASSENAAGDGPYMNQYGSVITTADRGTWVRFGVHLKLATSIAASNGEVRFYKNGALVSSNTGMPIGGTSFSNPADCFELMGWANSGFTQETIFFIDDVKIYSTNPGW